MPIDLAFSPHVDGARPDRIRSLPVCKSYGMLWALLRQYVRPYRWPLTVVAVLQVISTLASLYLPTINAADHRRRGGQG